jgi:hypothetical protein
MIESITIKVLNSSNDSIDENTIPIVACSSVFKDDEIKSVFKINAVWVANSFADDTFTYSEKGTSTDGSREMAHLKNLFEFSEPVNRSARNKTL